MEWEVLTEWGQVEQLRQLSNEIPVLIYKHSARCSTSRMILDRLERNWNSQDRQFFKPYFLDLIAYREISNAIALAFMVEHESPQVLVIENGQSIYSSSHYEINYHEILDVVKN